MTIKTLKDRFESNPNPQENLDYHNSRHTISVINDAAKIIEAVRNTDPSILTDKDVALIIIAAAGHDLVQNWREETIESSTRFPIKKRIRFTGTNEEESADETIRMMKGFDKVFGEEAYDTVREAILATIPAFKDGGVYQPNLNENSSIVTKVLALADLADAGIRPPEEFARQSFALFREENPDIKEVIKQPESLPDKKKQEIIKRVKDWIDFQVRFINSRQERFLRKEVMLLPKNVREAVKALFSHFDENLQYFQELLEKAENLDFDSLLLLIGYSIPTTED